jgi:hypothetical protein
MKHNHYIPMDELIINKETQWTFTKIHLPYSEIVKAGIVMWCVNNIEGRWTMLGNNKFGFEDSSDALSFALQFGMR